MLRSLLMYKDAITHPRGMPNEPQRNRSGQHNQDPCNYSILKINNPETTSTRRFNISNTNTPSFVCSTLEIVRLTLLKHLTPGHYILLYLENVATTTITYYILRYPPTW